MSVKGVSRRQITSAKPWFSDEDIRHIIQEVPTILRGQLAMGAWVQRLEQAAAQMAGARYAVACHSCTAGLEISLKSLGIGAGDEVIVPSQTFIATAMAVQNVGATPVFGDVDAQTHCLSPESMQLHITPQTRAVLLVHYGGLITPHLDEILHLCERNHLKLIEDAAHAHGAARNGLAAGSIGDAASFSYFATKVLTAGEGGVITTDNEEVYRLARIYQARGMDMKSPEEELFILPGHNVRMTEISALCGVVQHSHLEEFLERRRQVADIYARFLENRYPEIEYQHCPPGTKHAYWKFTINLPKTVDRVRLQRQMKEDWDVTVNWSYFPPVHLQPVFRQMYGTREGQCPVAEDICSRCLSLPMHVALTVSDAEYVCEAFETVYRSMCK